MAVSRREMMVFAAVVKKTDNIEHVLSLANRFSRSLCITKNKSRRMLARMDAISSVAVEIRSMADDPRRREWREEPPHYGTPCPLLYFSASSPLSSATTMDVTRKILVICQRFDVQK
jgi:hypothetical protein